ncbi:hypothetical protein CAEBREN_23673 [Caenorhabditis brenneri]|uniref:Uncharacterized protein n=1 Tax=Caenorhabditis brenneri TaxID=135651 RepID=G0NVD2_CAEBE|nr:hypothetical protein CAEBREN_23673 [Caenorhabditis brenneri]
MDLAFDDTSSTASVLEKGWKSARRFHNYNAVRHDPNLPPLDCPTQWAENFTNVENFLKALDSLRDNHTYLLNLLPALMNVPSNIKYHYEIWEEEFEHKKYTLHHHFSHGL